MAVGDGDGDSVRKQLEKGVDVNQEIKVHMLMHVCTYGMTKMSSSGACGKGEYIAC